jgi:hypothetical protein
LLAFQRTTAAGFSSRTPVALQLVEPVVNSSARSVIDFDASWLIHGGVAQMRELHPGEALLAE